MVTLEPGTVFARDFKVVRLIASGGMGAVYEVEQLSTSKTRALKVLHGQLAGDPKIRQRFEQEARVSARIESDHVVDVVAAGVEEPAGTPWLVMEYLKGVDLAKHLERRRMLPPGEVLEIFRQMGHALAAAHRAGLVHRDLKPENIFLAESRREGAPFTVKVLDFGIAKALMDAPGRATQAMGTPFWMAPEQTESSNIIQPATDVWAMGLIAYSLLTGACYWRSAARPDSAVAGVLIEMTTGVLDAPSIRAREYGRDTLLPPGFDAWFARCVARLPGERFPNAAECVAAMVPVLSGGAFGVPTALSASGPIPTPSPHGMPAGMPMSAPMQQPAPAMMSQPMPAMGAPMSAHVTPPWAPPAAMSAGPPMMQPPHGAIAMPAPRASEHRIPAWVLVVGVVVTAILCITGAVIALHANSRESPVAPPTPTLQNGKPPATPVMVPVPVGVHAPPGAQTDDPPTPLPAPVLIPAPLPRAVAIDNVKRFSDAGGNLGPAPAVDTILRRATPRVLACAQSAHARRELHDIPSFGVSFHVAPTGRAQQVSTTEVRSAAFTACLSDALFHLLFPRLLGETFHATYVVHW